MRELGVPFLVRWFMWAAVRLGSLTDPGGRPGWLRDLPRVLLVTIVALPVIALPSVAVLLGLAVFAGLEFVAYGVLLADRRMRPANDHEINRPRPGFRT